MAEADGIHGIIAAIRHDLGAAAEKLMNAAEAGLQSVELARHGDVDALSGVEGAWLGVLEACAFEDLIGQMLTQLQAVAERGPDRLEAIGDEALLNGPAAPGSGLDQAAVDRMCLE